MKKANRSNIVSLSLAFILPALVIATAAGTMRPQEVVTCGQDSQGTFSSGPTSYFAPGYSNGADACRAAQQGLKDAMVATTGATCDDEGCEPGSCLTRVKCLDAQCSSLSYGPPHCTQDPVVCSCSAYWSGDDFKVNCTDCL